MFKVLSPNRNTRWRQIVNLKPKFPQRKGKHASKNEGFMVNITKSVFNKERIQQNIRPMWLHGLELDCYVPDLKFALEFDGEQHYMYPNGLHKTRQEYDKQVRRDREKDKLCEKLRIRLIRVRRSDNNIPSMLKKFEKIGVIQLK